MLKPKVHALKTMLLLVSMLEVSSCATTVDAVTGATCPSLPEYSKETQAQAARELRALPPGTVIGGLFVPDYGRMRDGVRACLEAQK